MSESIKHKKKKAIRKKSLRSEAGYQQGFSAVGATLLARRWITPDANRDPEFPHR